HTNMTQLFPYTTLFRSGKGGFCCKAQIPRECTNQSVMLFDTTAVRFSMIGALTSQPSRKSASGSWAGGDGGICQAPRRRPKRERSEEHTSERQSRIDLV